MATHARLSAPKPNRKTNAITAIPKAHPISSRHAKNATMPGPNDNMENSKKINANTQDGSNPKTPRKKLTIIIEMINSEGRSGLTKRWPKFLDHISSRKHIENPIWLLNKRSQSKTAPIKTPAALATQLECPIKNCVTKPQITICTVGQ